MFVLERRSGMRWRHAGLRGALTLFVIAVSAGPAAAQFSVGGQKVAPTESNFAGVRQVTPRYGLVVQINHEVRPVDFDLGLVDEVYARLLRESRRGPVVPAEALPLVVTTQAKITRFGEGPRRRMFRFLAPEVAKKDFHLSPTAIFISDETLGDSERLRSILTRALQFHFDERFREAVDSMERPTPDRP